MRKSFIFFLAFVLLSVQTFASFPSLPSDPKIDIGYGVKINPNQLIKLTPAEYKKLTGHSLSLLQKIELKIIQKRFSKHPYGEGKSQLAALLLCFFLGGLGIHRFYLGYTWQGIVQLLTLGGLGIWVLIDFIRICTGDLKPKDGEYAKPL